MIERDYIMRQIALLTATILKVLGLKAEKDYPRAFDELQKGCRQLVGNDLDMMLKMSIKDLVQLYAGDQSIGTSRLYALGILLYEHGNLLIENDQQYLSEKSYLRSLEALLEVFLEIGEPIEERHDETIDSILQKLSSIALPSPVQLKTIKYYESRGRFDKAEDVLLDLLDQDPAYFDEGISFYNTLLKKSDDELQQGNLPRSEVLQALQRLQKKLTNTTS
jgi:tetratricopeptide (TPR) repeat protein